MNSKNKFPDSIKEYHSQSWQLEIIIAGGILFSLYSLGGDLRSFFLENESYSRTTTNQMLLFFGAYILSTVLLIGFSANLVLRSIWLAYLGLSFAFKEGINYDNIKGGAALKEKLRSEPTALDRVKKLEVWCKLSFSFAVLMGLFTLSLVVSMSIAIWLLNFISPGAGDIAVVTYSLLVLLGIVQLGLIDRLLITKKSNSFWSKIANGITSFLNVITISFLYRREALVLRTNVNRWLIYSFAFLYLGIAVVTSVSRVGQYYAYGTFTLNFFDDRENYDVISDNPMIYNEYDENLTSGDRITYATIQSEVIKYNYLKIFLESNQVFDSGLEYAFKRANFQKSIPDSLTLFKDRLEFYNNNREVFKEALKLMFEVKIDSVSYPANWYSYTHPITHEEGYAAFVRIDSISSSAHDLYLNFLYNSENFETLTYTNWIRIPFWKD